MVTEAEKMLGSLKKDVNITVRLANVDDVTSPFNHVQGHRRITTDFRYVRGWVVEGALLSE